MAAADRAAAMAKLASEAAKRALDERDAALERVRQLEEALTGFVRQVDEFELGNWDEKDWPAAMSGLRGLRDEGRRALEATKP